MKTSNIILVTIIGGITFTILAGALQLRFTGTKKDGFSEISSTIDLNEFRHIVVRNAVNLSLIPSPDTKMVIRTGKDEAQPTVQYRENGDTLVIDAILFGHKSRTMSVSIQLPSENLKTIWAEKSSFVIMDFHAGALQIHLDQSRLTIEADHITRMENISITGVAESQFHARNVLIDTCNIQLNNSHARIPDKVMTLAGSITNHSSLFAPRAANIAISKNSLSRWED
jgi:hypothetical protein